MIEAFEEYHKYKQNPKMLIPLKSDDSAVLPISRGKRPFDKKGRQCFKEVYSKTYGVPL